MHSRAKEIFIDYTSSFSEQKDEEERRGLSHGLCVPPPLPLLLSGQIAKRVLV